MQKKFEQFRPIVHQRMQSIINSGVPIVLGTDGMHGLLWQEAVYFVEHGGTPIRALQALTASAAKLLGVSNETGSLENGKSADILVVDKDPLADITSLKNVLAVYNRGEVVKGIPNG